MSQRYDQDLILAYVEDELGEAARQRFEQQLEQDPRLQTLVRQLVEDRRHLRRVAAQAAPVGLMDRAQGVLERQMLLGDAPGHPLEDAARNRHRLVRWTAISGIAALMLVGVGTLLFIFAETRSFQTVITRVDPREDRTALAASAAERETALRQAVPNRAGVAQGAKDAETPAPALAAGDTDKAQAMGAVLADQTGERAAGQPAGMGDGAAAAFSLADKRLTKRWTDAASPTATRIGQPAGERHDWPRQLWRQAIEPPVVPLAIQEPSPPARHTR